MLKSNNIERFPDLLRGLCLQKCSWGMQTLSACSLLVIVGMRDRVRISRLYETARHAVFLESHLCLSVMLCPAIIDVRAVGKLQVASCTSSATLVQSCPFVSRLAESISSTRVVPYLFVGRHPDLESVPHP